MPRVAARAAEALKRIEAGSLSSLQSVRFSADEALETRVDKAHLGALSAARRLHRLTLSKLTLDATTLDIVASTAKHLDFLDLTAARLDSVRSSTPPLLCMTKLEQLRTLVLNRVRLVDEALATSDRVASHYHSLFVNFSRLTQLTALEWCRANVPPFCLKFLPTSLVSLKLVASKFTYAQPSAGAPGLAGNIYKIFCCVIDKITI